MRIIKKIRLLYVCLSLLLLCACGHVSRDDDLFGTSEYLPDYDVPRGFTRAFLRFCRWGDTYYCVEQMSDRLMVCDSESGYSGPLCAKPECLHRDSDCNAYICSGISGLQVYDGKLYWAAKAPGNSRIVNIYSEELDGTGRRVVKELPAAILAFNADFYVQFHRGYAYFAGITDKVIKGVPSYHVTINAEELSAGGESIAVFERDYSAGYCTFRMQIIGSKVYYMVSTAERSPDDMFCFVDCKIEVCSWDMVSHETETIFDGNTPIAAREIWIVPDEGMYITSIDGSGGVCRLDFHTKETEFLFDFRGEERECDFPYFAENMVVATGKGYIMAKDFEGNIVFEKDVSETENIFLEENNMGVSEIYAAADDEYIYISYNTMRSYAAYPLDGSEAKVLWLNNGPIVNLNGF